MLEVVEVALHVVEGMDDMGRVLEVSEGLGHFVAGGRDDALYAGSGGGNHP